MSNQNLLLQDDPFAAPDSLEHLPSHHCAPVPASPPVDVPNIKERLIEFAGNSKDLRKLCYDACAHISSLEHAIAEASKDAARYRWLLANDNAAGWNNEIIDMQIYVDAQLKGQA